MSVFKLKICRAQNVRSVLISRSNHSDKWWAYFRHFFLALRNLPYLLRGPIGSPCLETFRSALEHITAQCMTLKVAGHRILTAEHMLHAAADFGDT